MNGHRTLSDDGSPVQSFIDKMHRASGHSYAILKRLSLRLEPGKGRQETRMNIQDPTAIRRDKLRREYAHVTRQTNEIDVLRTQCRNDFTIVFRAPAHAALDDQGFNSSLRRFGEARGVWLIANHDRNLSVGNSLITHRISQRDHVRAA